MGLYTAYCILHLARALDGISFCIYSFCFVGLYGAPLRVESDEPTHQWKAINVCPCTEREEEEGEKWLSL